MIPDMEITVLKEHFCKKDIDINYTHSYIDKKDHY